MVENSIERHSKEFLVCPFSWMEFFDWLLSRDQFYQCFTLIQWTCLSSWRLLPKSGWSKYLTVEPIVPKTWDLILDQLSFFCSCPRWTKISSINHQRAKPNFLDIPLVPSVMFRQLANCHGASSAQRHRCIFPSERIVAVWPNVTLDTKVSFQTSELKRPVYS